MNTLGYIGNRHLIFFCSFWKIFISCSFYIIPSIILSTIIFSSANNIQLRWKLKSCSMQLQSWSILLPVIFIAKYFVPSTLRFTLFAWLKYTTHLWYKFVPLAKKEWNWLIIIQIHKEFKENYSSIRIKDTKNPLWTIHRGLSSKFIIFNFESHLY